MIVLLLIMVSVSVTCNDSEEKLISNMETQDDLSDDQVLSINIQYHLSKRLWDENAFYCCPESTIKTSFVFIVFFIESGNE